MTGWVYRIMPRPGVVFPERAIVTFTSKSGSGQATFRNPDMAREWLATAQSAQIHEAARRYLEWAGEADTQPALFDLHAGA